MKGAMLILFAVCLTAPVFAEQTEVTVYNQNFALIKDQRTFELKNGLNTIEFRDVAALIEQTSVHFVSLTDPASATILEQNYEYDLINSDKLLSKYIDKSVRIVSEDERVYEGTLLSYDGGTLVISTQDGLAMVTRPENIRQIQLEKMPEGFITKPTLVWDIENEKAAKHLVEVSYLTGGINWQCEYVAVLAPDDALLDLDGWVSITNASGTAYNDAKLKLVAGDVKRARQVRRDLDAYAMVEASKAAGPQFEEKGFFEYHLYSLKRPATLKNNQTKQISLLNARAVPVTKQLIFDPSAGRWSYTYYSDTEIIKENVRVEMTLVNDKNSHLGMPLPQGAVKVYKKDDDGSLQFIGEDSIKHTPKDEKISLYIGDAFDVVGERKRLDYKSEYRTMTETYEISLRNHKEQDVSVTVREKMWRYANWTLVNSSLKGEKTDASTMEFKLPVARNSEQKLTYTVRYTW